MSKAEVILSGFADEGPVSKRAEEQLTMMQALGLSYYTLDTDDRLAQRIGGALTLCYASRQPLALCLTPLLHGGKLA